RLDNGTSPFPYRLGAQIVDAEGEVITPVEFNVNGTVADELAIEFAVPHTCMPHVSSSARAVLGVAHGALDQIQMVIPGATLEDVFSDTVLDVNLSRLCREPGADDPFEVVRASDPHLDTGVMSGSFVGAAATPGGQANFLQLGDCDEDYEDERFDPSRQQWIVGRQWLDVTETLDEVLADYKAAVNPSICPSETDVCPGSQVCLRGTCFDPTAACDVREHSWCGAELLADGNDWDLMRYRLNYEWPTLDDRFPADLDVPPLAGPLPEPDPSLSGCQLSDTTVTRNLSGANQVVVLADISSSMNTMQGDTYSRYDLATLAIGSWARKLAGEDIEIK
ncbi:MAG: hypothetical protein AAFX50_26845, partial [Acidobacteriota bacterium]